MGMGKGSLGGGSIYRSFTSYPRCQLFSCPRQRGVSYRCCFYCDRRDKCSDHCLNSPSRCGMCIIPEQEEEKPVMDLPDAPWIRDAERYGAPAPTGDDDVECPICGKVCDYVFRDIDGDICGCENCLQKIESYEWRDQQE